MKKIIFISFTFLIFLTISCSQDDTNEKPKDSFQGYKVSKNAKELGTDYWENTEVLMDLMVVGFQKPFGTRTRYSTFLIQLSCGDFNNDGYIDIFNPGASYKGIQGAMTFLIWNPTKLVFEEQNLLKDQSITSFEGNKVKTIPIYLNNDNFVDMILFTAEDEGDFYYSPKKLKILLSDGLGKYEVVDISHITPEISATGGDIGDLNGDKITDLVLTYGSVFKILWGTLNYPYFDTKSVPTFSFPIVNLIGGTIANFENNNGFGESCTLCIENIVNDISIFDVNKDGLNDLVLQQSESNNDPNNTYTNRILLNKGQGKFNNTSVIKLPKSDTSTSKVVSTEDYLFDDLNSDGKVDIIAVNQYEYRTWDMIVYIQNTSGVFEINKNWFQYSINASRKGLWKSQLIYRDFNNDGLKDITYFDTADNGETKFKSVFIRKGSQFVEEDIYKYDSFAKSVMNKINY